LPAGLPVAVIVTTPAEDDGDARIHNQTLRDDAKSGMGGGMVGGALAGLSCGPFYFLCVPAGMLVGGLTGTAAGAAVGLTGQLPQSKSDALIARLHRLRQRHDLLDELRSDVTDQLGRHRDVVADTSGCVVTIAMDRLHLTSTRDENISLVVRAVVTVRFANAPAPSANQKTYEYVSPPSPLGVWMDENDDFFDKSLSLANRQIANQLVAELGAK
jgi:hypothetical protein